MSLVSKINFVPIIKAHISTMVDARAPNRISKSDVAFFYGVPAIIAIILGWLVVPTESLTNVLITSLSVFAALLFNLLMLVLGVIEKRKGNRSFIEVQKETYANIAYAILISLVTVGLLLIPYFYKFSEAPNPSPIGEKIFWASIYFLLANFGFAMAMILKRMHSILVKLIEFE